MQKLGRKITLKEQEDFYVALMGEDVCCNGDNNQSTIEAVSYTHLDRRFCYSKSRVHAH